MLGFLFNYIYLARAGDVIKIIGLQRASGISMGWLGVSGVVDRLSDIIVLLCSAIILINVMPTAYFGSNHFYIASTALFLLLYAGISPIGEQILLEIQKRFFYGPNHPRWMRVVKKSLEGLLFFRQQMVHGMRLAKLTCAALLVALSDYISIYFLLVAFGWELPYFAPIVVWVFISFGSALPSAPGAIGIHQLACVLALENYGISAGDSFALSLTLQMGSFVAILIGMLGTLVYSALKRKSA
jgi:uncharacterized protein (TIRG00374 family)